MARRRREVSYLPEFLTELSNRKNSIFDIVKMEGRCVGG